MTFKQMIEYYEKQDEHYTISDAFVMAGYQQVNDGKDTYIGEAKKPGNQIQIDSSKAEPNQNGIFY